MLGELVDYLGATFLHADLGSGNFQNQTFIRTRGAFSVISDGFLVDVALLGGALVAGVLDRAGRRRGAGGLRRAPSRRA